MIWVSGVVLLLSNLADARWHVQGLTEGHIYPRLADQIAQFLAHTLFHTSLIHLNSEQFRFGSQPHLPAQVEPLHQPMLLAITIRLDCPVPVLTTADHP